jgi:tRNA-specific 2-thiouridylase
VATGHYAKIEKNDKSQKYELKRAKDKKKDQSYNLSFLPEKWLRYIIFPLGQYTKKEVYQMAKKEKLNDLLYVKESQNFCFVAEKSMNNFLQEKIGINPGIIKDETGAIIGKHQGLHFYTIGQRKGIKLPHGPYFVCKKEETTNTLWVTNKTIGLYQQKAILSPYFFSCNQPLLKRMRIQTKIRYQQQLTDAILIPICKNKSFAFGKDLSARLTRSKIKIIFAEPQKAITPGQLAVFYKKNTCLGGGIINKVENYKIES